MSSQNSDSHDIPLAPVPGSGESEPGQPGPGGEDDFLRAPAPEADSSEGPRGAAQEAAASWYVARRGGRNEGPYNTETLAGMVRSGLLRPKDLVWKEGMASWIPVRELPDVMGSEAPPLPPVRSFPSRVRAFLSGPAFFRIAALVFAAVALVVLLASAVLLFWGRSAFLEAILLLVAAVVCHATAAILDALRRLEQQGSDSH